MSPAEWIKSHNFAGALSRTITALNGAPNVSSGIQIDDLVHLYASLEGAKAVSLERQVLVGYLVITAGDAMAIEPGVQFSPHSNGIIGLTDPSVMTVEMIKELSTKNEKEIVSHLKNCKLNTQALEVHVTSIDDKVSQPVAVFYGGTQGGWQTVNNFHEQLGHVLNMCKSCLESNCENCNFRCNDCWQEKSLCSTCNEWHSAARPRTVP